MDMSKGDHRIDTRGAGAIFDIGIYCIAPFLMMADRDPVGMAANATRNDLGVDIMMAGWIDWGQGFSSAFDVSFDAPLRRQMALSGSLGLATFQANMYRVPHAGVRSRSSGATVRSTPSAATERMRMPGWCRISKRLPEGKRSRSSATSKACAWRRSSTNCTTSPRRDLGSRWAGFSRRRDVGGWAGAGAAARASRGGSGRRRCNSTDSAESARACRSRLARCPAYDIHAQPVSDQRRRRRHRAAAGVRARYRGPASDRSAPRPRLQRCSGIARSTKGVAAQPRRRRPRHPADGNDCATAAGNRDWSFGRP